MAIKKYRLDKTRAGHPMPAHYLCDGNTILMHIPGLSANKVMAMRAVILALNGLQATHPAARRICRDILAAWGLQRGGPES